MLTNPTRPLVLLPILSIVAALAWLFGLPGDESAKWMLVIFVLLVWGWIWDIHDHLGQMEKRLSDAEKSIESLTSTRKEVNG